jgi:hypothetical protein
MILSHPCVRYAHIDANRTLVIGTDLEIPEPGQSCNDDRLLDFLEYLEVLNSQFKGKFDSVEIRGSKKAGGNKGLPHFIPPGERCFNDVCV